MLDLKIMTIRDLLTISSADFAKNVVPASLVINGERFDQATKVLINDIESPEFMIVSSNSILAQIPDNERNSLITKLAVLAESPSPTRSSILHFEVPGSMKTLKGVERLVQLFCKLLLQTPGSDRFNKDLGGGLLTLIGRSMSKNEAKSVQSAVVSAINKTRDQIIAVQGQNSRIPADERLLTAKTEAVGYEPTNTAVTARVSISAVSGRQAIANLTF